MDQFRTIVPIEPQKNKVSYDSRLLFMGSCFASNIGSYFTETGFNAMVNPFGVLYNPISIAGAIERLISGDLYRSDNLKYYNGLWQSFDHHSQFNHEDQEQCLHTINQSLIQGAQFLKNADYLFITFGTSWVYEWNETDKIVSNCHKFPASHFNRFLASQIQITERYKKLITQLHWFNPDLKIILTVSPVRHWKDGAHGNQISKAILLLSIEELCQQYEHLLYFPAYEILLDELRDYRFFDDDMLHPSSSAVKYIRSRFTMAWLDNTAHKFIKSMEQIKNALNHRPFNPRSEQHQLFLQKTLIKLEEMKKAFPNIDFTTFLTTFKEKIC